MPRMRHPGLPESQVIDAQDVQVHHYQASGWQLVPDDDGGPPQSPEQPTEAPADAGASASPAPARRSRKSEEE